MSDLRALWEQSSDFLERAWREGVFGASYPEVLLAAGVVMAAVLLRGVLAAALVRALSRAAPKRSALIQALVSPLKLAILILALDVARRALPFSSEAQAWGDQVVHSLIAATIFWSLSRVADAARAQLAPLAEMLTPAAVDWLVKSLHILFLVVGAAAILEIWGVQVAPLLAGLGIFGVAVALGAQDLFKNLIAGLAILAEKRFAAGDWISVEGVVEGTVEQINFRSTIVRRFDLSPVYVPNARLSDNPVVNFSRMTYRRIHWKLGLEYAANAQQLRNIRQRIEDYLSENGAFVAPPSASRLVHIEDFGENAINVMLYCFTRTTSWGAWLAIKEELALAVRDIIEDEGAAFAFPTRTVHLNASNAGAHDAVGEPLGSMPP